MMFVHSCRVCCGGNILVASTALMFCILMSLAENTGPIFETVGNWACFAFIAFCENMMYLFWKVGQFSAAFVPILFKRGRQRQHAPRDGASGICEGGGEDSWRKERVIIATMRTVMVMMMMVVMCHSFPRGLFRVFLPLRCYFPTVFLLDVSSQLCTPSALFLSRLCRSVFPSLTLVILHFCKTC